MSLTARIVIDPSWSLVWAQRLMPATGIAWAAATLVARWPGLSAAWIALAALVAIVVVVRERRASRGTQTMTFDVSARPEVDVRIGGEAGTWRLGESTVVWPGFAMLAMTRDGESHVALRRAVVMDEVHATDRRALQRFLVWSLRARATGPADRKSGS